MWFLETSLKILLRRFPDASRRLEGFGQYQRLPREVRNFSKTFFRMTFSGSLFCVQTVDLLRGVWGGSASPNPPPDVASSTVTIRKSDTAHNNPKRTSNNPEIYKKIHLFTKSHPLRGERRSHPNPWRPRELASAAVWTPRPSESWGGRILPTAPPPLRDIYKK